MSEIDQEIADQPRCWRIAAADAVRAGSHLPAPGARVAASGCGTSYYVAQAYASLREQAGQGETDAFPASEMPLGRDYEGVVLITRSGTTTEILDLIPRLSALSRVIAITAAPQAPVVRMAQDAITLEFADEASIVQTRFATSVLALLRAHLGQDVGALAAQAERALTAQLPFDPARFRQFVFLGRGAGAALASEAALKMRETGAAWSEAYPAMEFRHGPISTVGPHSAVWSLGPAPDGLGSEVRSTGATWAESAEDPMVALLLAQRLAVANARGQGLDPGHPRFLTRSVILPEGSSVR
jgi:fructoselysine-6-P-deglycase FrlB-like protein